MQANKIKTSAGYDLYLSLSIILFLALSLECQCVSNGRHKLSNGAFPFRMSFEN